MEKDCAAAGRSDGQTGVFLATRPLGHLGHHQEKPPSQ